MSDQAREDRGQGVGDPELSELGATPDHLSSLGAHFYRSEMERAATWRGRLDQTTNWAVVVIAAILTWAFSSDSNPHYVILIGQLATVAFLFIEAHRYREYDVWRARVRLLQDNFFAPVFDGKPADSPDWRSRVGANLRGPELQMPFVRAVGHRLQRVYFPLLTVLLAAWLARIAVYGGDTTWRQEAAVADVPGLIVVGVVLAAYLVALALTVWSYHSASTREFDGDETAPPAD